MGSSESNEARRMIKLYCKKSKEGIQEDLEGGKWSEEFNYIIASKVKRIKGKIN